MRVAGIDCGGSKVAVAILDGDELSVHVWKNKDTRATRHEILRNLTSFAALWVDSCDAAYIEEPVVGRGVRASLQVAMTAGAVMSHLSVPSYFVNISSWKKAVIGNGNASKGLVGITLQELHPRYSTVCGGDQDLADATCIALYGAQQLRLVQALRSDD